MKNIMYFVSLAIITVSILLIIEFPESNRMNLIAGILAPIGFGLNIASYFIKNKQEI